MKTFFVKHIFPLFFICIISQNTIAQENTIYLQGNIETRAAPLEVIFIIDHSNEDKNTSMYVPKQFIYDMQAQTKLIEDSIIITIKNLKAEYTGVWNDTAQTYVGSWKQGNQNIAVGFNKIKKTELSFLERPQTPQPPFAYIEKTICIENKKGNSTLCGTLTLPDNQNQHKLVILITGSGAQDRNEEIAGHQPFKVIADYLTNQNIAVFRYDDRGVGESKGNFSNATTYDFMTDAYTVVNYFKDYPNIDAQSIGVIGHSEGGMIAMMLAAKYPKDIAYIISLAGPAINIKSLMLKQSEEINRAAGINESDILLIREINSKSFDIAIKSKDISSLRKQIEDLFESYSTNLTQEQKEELMLNQRGINLAVMQLSSDWMKYFLAFEPAKYLRKIKCPILALNGTKDIQVDCDENIEAFTNNINPKKCKTLETQKMKGLNHLFQTAENGTVEEYFYISETFSVETLKIIADFIERQ
ncbi:MAG: alpha/beta fold hydrolase [Bacteroidales bacterium]|nr:alpha/beta fold hydrolase [Bacteroidales bacterium]